MANGDITLTIGISGTTSKAGDAVATFSESKTISSISDYIDRTLTIPTSTVTVLAIGTVSGQTLAAWNCLVVQNMDASNYLTLGLLDTSAKSAYYRINAGEFFVLMRDQMDADGATGAAWSEFNSIDTVNLLADTAGVVARVIAF